MQTQTQENTTDRTIPAMTREEYVTIIAPTIVEVMKQFQARGLDVLGYAIMGRVARHQFAFAQNDATQEMFEGQSMLAATFMRQIPVN